MSVKILISRAVCQEPKHMDKRNVNGFEFPETDQVKVIADKLEFLMQSNTSSLMGVPVLEPVKVEAELLSVSSGKKDLYLTVGQVVFSKPDIEVPVVGPGGARKP